MRNAGWHGDGITSGFIGLAYPSIGSAYSGTNLTNDSAANQGIPSTSIFCCSLLTLPVIYNPIFNEMISQNLVQPVFSVLLNRHSSNPSNRPGPPSDGPDGYLALGGVVPGQTRGKWAKAPVEYVALGPGYLDTILPYPQYRTFSTHQIVGIRD